MPLKAAVRVEASRHRLVQPRFERAVKKILSSLGWKHAEISVLLTTDPDIRKINREFLNHDYATDVIAFGAQDKIRIKSQKKNEPVYIGDIVVSLDTAAARCGEYGNTFSYEILFYVCHGILHLMGHDDSTAQKSKAMHRKQAEVLRRAGLDRARMTA